MDDLFAPPGAGWHRVSPALATLRRILLMAWLVLVTIAVAVVWVVLSLPTWLPLLGLAALVAVGVGSWIMVGRSVRRWGYAEQGEELYIVRGALFRRLVVVPYGRMQYVDVQAGPLDRLFGLARVQLHTAAPGTTAYIPGLPADEAADLRDRLTALGEAQAAGL